MREHSYTAQIGQIILISSSSLNGQTSLELGFNQTKRITSLNSLTG